MNARCTRLPNGTYRKTLGAPISRLLGHINAYHLIIVVIITRFVHTLFFFLIAF